MLMQVHLEISHSPSWFHTSPPAMIRKNTWEYCVAMAVATAFIIICLQIDFVSIDY